MNLFLINQLDQLLNFIFSKTFNSKFSYIEVWFTDQNSKPPEIENKINITLVIKLSVNIKNDMLFEFSNAMILSST